jgi:pyruvate dehydrogenase E2 component (dihydrolipoamide acetyltransferase)
MAKMRTRRKLAIASWSSPREGNIYGKMTVDATHALAYIKELRETTGERVTITHLVGKAVAEGLVACPDLNGVIRLGSFTPHKTVDIAYLVALTEGANLAKAKIENADKKSVTDISRALRELAEKLRKGKDETFEKSQGPLKLLPTWMIRPLVFFTGYLASVWGVNLKGLGLEPYPFGSAIVTSVGMMGLDEGFAPPTPWAYVPLYVVVGAIREQPAVVDGEVVIQPQLTVTATLDHRFIDGAQGAILAKRFREIMANPWQLDGNALPESTES